jgi:protein-tyrosine phosphatase
MIDLHSHVLPGLDDGAANLDEAVSICRAAAEDGIEVLAATPHVRDDFPTTPHQMQEALAAVRGAAGDVVRLVPGAEVALEELKRPLDELRAFGLAGNPGYLLVETPYLGWPLDIGRRFEMLLAADIVPVLAHPERNPDVQLRPALLAPLVGTGALVQITAASIDGRFGPRARACARRLLEAGLVHLVASDAHSPQLREIGMSAAARAIRDEPLARWLTADVPRAIVEGRPLPLRPERRRQRFGLPRRGRL